VDETETILKAETKTEEWLITMVCARSLNAAARGGGGGGRGRRASAPARGELRAVRPQVEAVRRLSLPTAAELAADPAAAARAGLFKELAVMRWCPINSPEAPF
jgi:hypothetical protein